MEIKKMSYADWIAEGEKLFGPEAKKWRFVCPICGYVQSGEDFMSKTTLEKERVQEVIGFSCIGRWIDGARESFEGTGEGPCNYAGGGLFRMNPIHIERDGATHQAFDFDRSDGETTS